MAIDEGYSMRSYRVSDILDEGIVLYKKNFQFLFGVSIIVGLLMLVCEIYMQLPVWMAVTEQRYFIDLGVDLPYGLPSVGNTSLFTSLSGNRAVISVALYIIMFIFILLVKIKAADAVWRGETVGIGRPLLYALKRLPVALLSAIFSIFSLSVVAVIVLLITLIPAALVLLANLYLNNSFLQIPLYIFLYTVLSAEIMIMVAWFHLSFVSFVRDGTGIFSSIKRSAGLMRRDILRIAVVVLMGTVISFAIQNIPLGFVALISYFAGINNPLGIGATGLTSNIISSIIRAAAGSFSTPILFCCLVVLHADLIRRREGHDLYYKVEEILGS